jgi:ankyrin repeat protein
MIPTPKRAKDIHQQVEVADVMEVQELLRDNCRLVSSTDRSGRTPLHTASDHLASFSHRRVVELLLAWRADVNARDESGARPLHLAAARGKCDVAEALVAHGADIDARDEDGRTPLHFAAQKDREPKGRMAVVELLVARGADINAREKKFGHTPLHEAALYRNRDVAEALVALGADTNARDKFGETPLHVAVGLEKPDIAEMLATHGANVNVAENKASNTPLHKASQKGDEAMVKLLLAYGADVNARNLYGTTPLTFATNHEAVRSVLLEHGGQEGPVSTAASKGAFFEAARAGNLPTIKALLNKDPYLVFASDCDRHRETRLHYASCNGHKDVVEYLLANKAPVDWTTDDDDDRQTPLHYASASGRKQVAAVLLANGADPEAVAYNSGFRPLHSAVRGLHLEVVELLLAHGANVNARTRSFRTPLRMATALDSGNIGWAPLPISVAGSSSSAAKHMKDPKCMAIAVLLHQRGGEYE